MTRAHGLPWLLSLMFLAPSTALLGCGGGEKFELPRPGPGVVFSYPFNGQMDVPVGARLVVSFSDPVDSAAINAACSGTGNNVSGGFCVSGPEGLVSGSLMIAGGDGNIVHFSADSLRPGVDYNVFIGAGALGADNPATNLPESGPLFSFRTRQDRSRGGEPPVVWTVNGQDPAEQRLPFPDFGTVRVLLSEPLDPATVMLGSTFEFVLDDGNDTPVDGNLLVAGTHISFDPTDDLTPGSTYRMRLSDSIRDLGGEAMEAVEFTFTPQDTRVEQSEVNPDRQIVQVLNTEPGVGDPNFPLESPILGDLINSIRVVSQLVGETSIDVKDANLRAVMGNPAGFEAYDNVIPLTIRKGQLIESTGLDVRLGGAVPANLQTGDVTVRFTSDATGFVTRNPYRPVDTNPDDIQSPLAVFLSFDAAVTAVDSTGNAVLNQPLLGVQVAGVAVVREGSLVIETAGSMELDLLGVSKAPANLILAMATSDPEASVPSDSDAPMLSAAYPFDGQDDFSVTDSIVLVFTEPVEARAGDIELTQGGNPVDILVQPSGGSLLVTPVNPLSYDRSYTLRINNAVDMVGNAVSQNVGDAAGGDGTIEFSTPVLSGGNASPPHLTSLFPGVPCALEGATAESPGRCAGGEDSDDLYAPFTMPANGYAIATFDKPMDRDTMSLGTTCGTGSVRLEALDEGGLCEGPVPATLIRRERSFRVMPNENLIPGKRYRFVLGTGTNSSCGTGELCGANGQPLNPDPLNGGEGGDGGGPTPTVVMEFLATDISEDTFVPAGAGPYTDINGSGFIENGEIRRDENRAAMKIVDTSGLGGLPDLAEPDCVPATQELENCIYVNAAMPVSMMAAETNCTIDGENYENCIPAVVYPQIIYTTSMAMDITVIFTFTLETGRTVMRVRETDGQPSLGYVVEDPDTGAPVLFAELGVYMDAPDMALQFAHDLQSKELTMKIRGPVAFSDDGRMQISASNIDDIEVLLDITVGTLTMQIAAGEMKLQLMSEPLKGVRR